MTCMCAYESTILYVLVDAIIAGTRVLVLVYFHTPSLLAMLLCLPLLCVRACFSFLTPYRRRVLLAVVIE